MSTYGHEMTLALGGAGQDLATFLDRAVTVGGTLAVSPALAVGLVKTKSNTGQNFTVAYAGHSKGVAGGAITVGTVVGVSSGGWLIASAIGSTGVVGRALATAASGDLFEVAINFATP